MTPKISIVTICKNAADGLRDTLASVAAQTYPHIEHIVVDGASQDATLDLLQATPHLARWISEPDHGIADAMNKAYALSTGDYIYYLHADDYLDGPEALTRAVAYLRTGDIIAAFNIRFGGVREGTRVLRPRGFNGWMNFKSGIYHQGVLCHRTVFERIGLFDPQLRIAMDYDFFLRAYRAGLSLSRYDFTLAIMRDTGISSRRDRATLAARFAEERAVHRAHSAGLGHRLLYAAYWPAYRLYRRLAHSRA